jgi:hypothetical protein
MIVCKNTSSAKAKCSLYFPSYAWTTEGATTASRAAFAVHKGKRLVAGGKVKLRRGIPAAAALGRKLTRGTYKLTIKLGSGKSYNVLLRVK